MSSSTPKSNLGTNSGNARRCGGCGGWIGAGDQRWYCKSAPSKRSRARCVDCGAHSYSDRASWATGATGASGSSAATPIDPLNTSHATVALSAQSGRYIRRAYASVLDFVDDLARTCNRAANRSIKDRLLAHPCGWNGNTDLGALNDRVARPPVDGLSSISDIRDAISGSFEDMGGRRRKRIRNQDTGDTVDPWRALGGDSDCWERMHRVKSPRGVLRVACNSSLLGGQSPSVMLYRGAAAAALADALNAQGYRVDVCSVGYSNRSESVGVSTGNYIETLVQRADAPQDLALLSLALADIGWTRAGIFAARVSSFDDIGETIRDGLGCPGTMPSEERARFDFILDSDIRDLPSAIRAVRSMLGSNTKLT